MGVIEKLVAKLSQLLIGKSKLKEVSISILKIVIYWVKSSNNLNSHWFYDRKSTQNISLIHFIRGESFNQIKHSKSIGVKSATL